MIPGFDLKPQHKAADKEVNEVAELFLPTRTAYHAIGLS